jgi:hypothetical protein
MALPATPFVVRAPSQMYAVAACRDWDFAALPGPDDCRVVLDLHSWKTVTATAVIGIIVTLADLVERDYEVQVVLPDSLYARRMLTTVGFVEAIETFTQINGPKPIDTICNAGNSHFTDR